jgi:uncharacterized membrane protein
MNPEIKKARSDVLMFPAEIDRLGELVTIIEQQQRAMEILVFSLLQYELKGNIFPNRLIHERIADALKQAREQEAKEQEQNMNLTDNEQKVYDLLKEDGGWNSPTYIGDIILGVKGTSSWASRILKKLVGKGLVERNSRDRGFKGWYRAIKN